MKGRAAPGCCHGAADEGAPGLVIETEAGVESVADGAEQGRRGLVRAVGPAQPLDRLVGPPAGLQQVVDAALGVTSTSRCG